MLLQELEPKYVFLIKYVWSLELKNHDVFEMICNVEFGFSLLSDCVFVDTIN